MKKTIMLGIMMLLTIASVQAGFWAWDNDGFNNPFQYGMCYEEFGYKLDVYMDTCVNSTTLIEYEPAQIGTHEWVCYPIYHQCSNVCWSNPVGEGECWD